MKLNTKLSEAQSHLDAIEEQSFDNLDFEWEGIHFNAAAKTARGGISSIELKAELGRLYFTVEDKNQRAMALERIFATNRTIDGRYSIGDKGDISFRSTTHTDAHTTGSALISALTIILLEAENHLRALRSHLKAPQLSHQ
ncbi:MAG: hypothetical protein JKY60_18095 [Kordiimonadaceae bacterium]|nr:hypothetical protein [Kordiimonadaceae bacterium]